MEELHKLANDLYFDEQYEEAIDIYNELICNKYNISIMYSNKAACYLQLKHYTLALQNSLKSVEVNLNNVVAWGRIGYSYKGLKMFAESLNAFGIAHKLDKNNKIYLKELIFFNKRFTDKINKTTIFNLLINNKDLFNKIKNIKNNVIDNDISEIVNEILNKL